MQKSLGVVRSYSKGYYKVEVSENVFCPVHDSNLKGHPSSGDLVEVRLTSSGEICGIVQSR